MVLHDLNLACRYAHHVVAMRAGRIVTCGPPGDVVTAEHVRSVFGLDCVVIDDPVSHTPLVVPVGVAAAPVDDQVAVSDALPNPTPKRTHQMTTRS